MDIKEDNIYNNSENDLINNLGSNFVNSLDFAKNKNNLLTSGNDDIISIIDLEIGDTIQTISSNLFGCDNTIFINDDKGVLTSSFRDYRINHWSLMNQELIHSYLGHSAKVTEISINPVIDKYMLTSSIDRTSRIWDLSARSCVFIIQDSVCAAFNQNGKLLASITYEEDKKKINNYINYVNIYSLSHLLEGPFKVFTINEMSKITQIKFSSDGLLIFVKDENNLCNSYNIFDDNLVDLLVSDQSENEIKFDLFSTGITDYIAIGSDKGTVNIWNTNNNPNSNTDRAYIVRILKHHKEESRCVKYSNKHKIFASADKEVAIWSKINK